MYNVWIHQEILLPIHYTCMYNVWIVKFLMEQPKKENLRTHKTSSGSGEKSLLVAIDHKVAATHHKHKPSEKNKHMWGEWLRISIIGIRFYHTLSQDCSFLCLGRFSGHTNIPSSSQLFTLAITSPPSLLFISP